VSAGQLAQQLGDRLPAADTVPASAFDLAEHTRRFVEAVVLTDVDDVELAAVAAELGTLTARLDARRRPEPLYLVRHPDGRVESLLNAGSGRLNPQSAPIEWVHRPAAPPPGTEPVAVEVTARCTYTAQHAGSPGRVYGGVLALTLDEAIGIALWASGAGGMTVSLTVSLRGAAPLGRPLDIAARYTGHEGRKNFATGEVTVDGVVVAEASAIYVMPR
jgi:acyl-coenzyme A thioesterase PaaI-like protein